MKKFYSNKKILITGHTGFKGIWLCTLMLSFGAKVYGISINDHNKKNYKKLCDSKKIKNYYFDILNKNLLRQTIKKINPKIIFHLAAQSLVKMSYDKPIKTFETNIIGTLNILESSKILKRLKSLIIVTSDKCYRNNDKKFYFRENDPLGGIDPYSASKAAAEIVFNSYLQSYYRNKKIGLASVRAGNVIGGGDWSSDRIIPDCARSIMKKTKLIIRNPNSTRPWQHVIDVIYGYTLLGMNLYKKGHKFSGNWNFGPRTKKNLNVINLVNFFISCLSVSKNIRILKNNKKINENKNLYLDSSKAKKLLKWKNLYDTKKSIKLTADWYINFLKKKDTKKLILKQINQYLQYYNIF